MIAISRAIYWIGDGYPLAVAEAEGKALGHDADPKAFKPLNGAKECNLLEMPTLVRLVGIPLNLW